jgi:hypothetical protein
MATHAAPTESVGKPMAGDPVPAKKSGIPIHITGLPILDLGFLVLGLKFPFRFSLLCHLPFMVQQCSFNMDFAFRYFETCLSYGSYVLVLSIVVDDGPPNYRQGLATRAKCGCGIHMQLLWMYKERWWSNAVQATSSWAWIECVSDLDRTTQNRKAR